MKAMQLNRIVDLSENHKPLTSVQLPEPKIIDGEVLIKVTACGVCHTELDEIEGRTPPPSFPVIPGHQVVGYIVGTAPGESAYKINDRVGVGWIYSACGKCAYCLQGLENLCPEFKATGRDENGGYAEYMKADAKFIYRIPDFYSDAEASPLFCAGAIGYRSLHLSQLKNGQFLGLTGFGASAHLVLKLVRFSLPEVNVFVFARSENERSFARELGAVWTGDIGEKAPEQMHAIIDTTPVWKPVVDSLKNLRPNGRLVINAIRKEDYDKDYLQQLSYHEHLWMEKEIKSVANVTKDDISEFLKLAAEAGIRPEISKFPLGEANTALMEVRNSKIRGAKVLVM
ncbi:MAG: zinc-dependent alcohol dehydrogenase family protein [Cyclobacteriaceae bacterium]|nr:zinc-dependent alcohol dehydrogenase family protein [Cyclobacteriaceae bacterium]